MMEQGYRKWRTLSEGERQRMIYVHGLGWHICAGISQNLWHEAFTKMHAGRTAQ